MARHAVIERKKSPYCDSVLETLFVALVYFLSLLSIIAVTLLSVGYFTPVLVALGAVTSALTVTWILRNRFPVRNFTWPEWSVLAVLLLALALRSNPATYLSGGQDPAVYSAMALHFARTGTLELHDTLLPELSSDEGIRSYYLKKSMHRLREKRPNKWIGNMLPGVYLSDLQKNQWDFQFYALHPTWLAIGKWLFGVQAQSWILVFFSTLTVLCSYFLTRAITGNHIPGLCAALLLATNPGHSYIATFPVSETVAGFFFLSSLYLLLDKRFMGFLCPLTALFLTRITGFITAPLLLLSLGWIVLRRRDLRALWAGYGVIAAYAISFYWGLTFSPHYSFDIYKSKLGLGRPPLAYAGAVFIALGILWSMTGYLATRRRLLLRRALQSISRHRYHISAIVVALIIGVCVYRGYLLAFTDHYQGSRWFSKRWNMAGQGWVSVSYLSVNTLRLLLSSVGLVAFAAGLLVVGALACRRALVAPIPMLAAGFAGAYLIGQLTTPVSYYYARYLVSEVVPLAIICAVIGIEYLRKAIPKVRPLLFPVYCACVLWSVWPSLVGRLSATEGEGLSRAVECLDTITGPNSVLLIDRQRLAFGAYAYSTPLRLGFGKRTYTVAYNDFAADPKKLEALVAFFQKKGLEVFLLSSQTQWKGRSNFTHALTLSITQENLFARGRLPRQFSARKRTVRLFAQRYFASIPPVCEPLAK